MYVSVAIISKIPLYSALEFVKNITGKPKDPRYILVETISAKRRIELKNYVKKLEELIQVLP